jgi:hypothetical protein
MFSFVRASGLAAAGVALAATAAFADPSLALDVEAVPVTARYIDHAAAQMDGSALAGGASQEATFQSFGPGYAGPTPSHAVATPAKAPAFPLELDQKIALAPRSLADLVGDHADDEAADAEQECLAGAVYFEAKGEPLEGQLAVAEVILNRTEADGYPNSICGVVKQKAQFSFVRGGRIPAIPKTSAAWRKAVAIAHIAQNELAESAVADALFFHANYVRPGWRGGLTRVAALGNHVFYR